MSDEKKTTQLTGAFYLGGRRLDTSHGETMEYVRSRFAAKPAQPVEAVDAFAPIPEAEIAPTPELWRAYEAFNGEYKGFNTQQALRAAINGVLAERATIAHPRPTGSVMVSVVAEDANNYCRILTALGMEEEGDPVAEVEQLIAAAYDQGTADAGVTATIAPTGEQAGEVVPYTAEVVAEVVRGDDGQNKLSFVIEGAEAALEVGEALYVIAGLPMPEDGAVDVYLAQPRPMGVPDGWKLVPAKVTTAQRLAMAKADDETGDRYRLMGEAMLAAAPVAGGG